MLCKKCNRPTFTDCVLCMKCCSIPNELTKMRCMKCGNDTMAYRYWHLCLSHLIDKLGKCKGCDEPCGSPESAYCVAHDPVYEGSFKRYAYNGENHRHELTCWGLKIPAIGNQRSKSNGISTAYTRADTTDDMLTRLSMSIKKRDKKCNVCDNKTHGYFWECLEHLYEKLGKCKDCDEPCGFAKSDYCAMHDIKFAEPPARVKYDGQKCRYFLTLKGLNSYIKGRHVFGKILL